MPLNNAIVPIMLVVFGNILNQELVLTQWVILLICYQQKSLHMATFHGR